VALNNGGSGGRPKHEKLNDNGSVQGSASASGENRERGKVGVCAGGARCGNGQNYVKYKNQDSATRERHRGEERKTNRGKRKGCVFSGTKGGGQHRLSCKRGGFQLFSVYG